MDVKYANRESLKAQLQPKHVQIVQLVNIMTNPRLGSVPSEYVIQLHIGHLRNLTVRKILIQRMTVMHVQRENILTPRARRLKMIVKIALGLHTITTKEKPYVPLATLACSPTTNAQDVSFAPNSHVTGMYQNRIVTVFQNSVQALVFYTRVTRPFVDHVKPVFTQLKIQKQTGLLNASIV
jgi:hypothetical protein